jgi:CHAD domain-containing protein
LSTVFSGGSQVRRSIAVEVEAKFIIPDESTLQRLLETVSLAGFALGEETVTEIHDRYLDTEDGALLMNGFSCRLRRENHHYIATVKGLGSVSGAIHHRAEYETDLPEPSRPVSWPPSTARELVLRLSGGKPLVPLLEIKQTRHRRVLQEGQRPVAELVLDRVRFQRGRCRDEDRDEEITLELEVELLPDGGEGDLRRIALELEGRWGLPPQPRSKFERGLAQVRAGPESVQQAQEINEPRHSQSSPQAIEESQTQEIEPLEEPGLEPNDPMSEAGRKTLRFHFRQMLFHEPGTRQGEDTEALHDMRVATRRMRAAFRVFGEYYEPKAVKAYRKGLKRTGRVLGAVRDLDVFGEKIEAYLGGLSEEEPGGMDGLLAVVEEQRERARQWMMVYLDGDRYQRFVERFGEFVETEGLGSLPVHPPDGGDPRPYRVCHVAPMTIYERLAVVRAYDEWVTLPDPPVGRLHALRIACKRLRYTLEFFVEVLGPDAKPVVKAVVTMQDHLGAVQDAVVACGILRDYLTWGTWGHEESAASPSDAPADAPGVQAYLRAKEAELENLLERFPEAWHQLEGPEFRRMVAEMVADL